MKLSVELYHLKVQDRDVRSQLNRAALSISNNISEGFERDSRRSFANFLTFAKGSAGEVRNVLFFMKEVEMIDLKTYTAYYNRVTTLSKQIMSLKAYLLSNKNVKRPDTVNEDDVSYGYSNL